MKKRSQVYFLRKEMKRKGLSPPNGTRIHELSSASCTTEPGGTREQGHMTSFICAISREYSLLTT